MKLNKQQELYNLVINELNQHESLIPEREEVNSYIFQLLNGNFDVATLNKKITITVLNNLNFKIYFKVIKILEKKYPGFLLLLTAMVLNNVKDSKNEGINKIEQYYTNHPLPTTDNNITKKMWDDELQLVIDNVLLDKFVVNDNEFFFARIKLLLDTDILSSICDIKTAFEVLIYNDYTINTISKISPIFSGCDSDRNIDIEILIKQYCNLQLHSVNDGFKITENKLTIKQYEDNTEVQAYLTAYLTQLRKVEKKVLAKLTIEIMTVLNRLSLESFIEICFFMDVNRPGLSIHFAMEARTNEENEAKWFLKTIKTLEKDNMLNKIYSPSRIRLVKELLRDEDVQILNNEVIKNYTGHEFITLLKSSTIFNKEDIED